MSQGLFGDHHPGRMDGGMPGEALQGAGRLHQLLQGRIGRHQFSQLPVGFQGPGNGHARFHGDHLRQAIHLAVGKTVHPPHVPDGPPGSHGPKGNDLGHPIGPVPFHHIIYDLVPAVITKIDIDVGHADPFGIEEAFEEKAVGQGIHIGYAQAVGDETPGRRTPAGAD